MNLPSLFSGRVRAPGLSLSMLLIAAVAGCGRDDVQVYRVAKEAPPQQPVAAAPGLPAGHPEIGAGQSEAAGGGHPGVGWQTPAGWEEVPPGEMRVGSFRVKGEEGKVGDVSIVPLPGMAGSDLANVNRWRGQVGLPEVGEGELTKLAEPVQVGGQASQLYDQAGINAASGEKTRILAAVLRHDGVAWFFKLTGPEELVAKQKPVFVQFLGSVVFAPATSAAETAQIGSVPRPLSTNAKPGAREAGDKPGLTIPAGWQEVVAGQMLAAEFVIPGSGGTKAELNVSNLAGTGGGLLANVNRWRGQLGLAPMTEPELQQQTESFEVSGGKAIVISLSGTDAKTGQPARLLGAIVPRAEQTWFYKMMGNEQVVEREKAAFTKFVQSAKY